MTARATAARVRLRVAGVAYFAVILAFLTLLIAVYEKVFTHEDHILLRTDHVGNQLQPPADVKVRGVIVGEVRSIRSTGSGAQLDLAMDPNKINLIPRDVSARLLPKTLFGERFVSLVVPPHAKAGPRLAAGDVIDQDHSKASIELDKVLSDLMPLLQTLQPDKLATTLNTLSAALHGRGAQMGDTAVTLNDYLKRLNPLLPNMAVDFRALGDVAQTYSQAAPDLVQALDAMTTTTTTIAEQKSNLDHLYGSLTTTSVSMADFMRANGTNMIDLGSSSRPALDVLAKYAPEYPCLFGGLTDLIPRVDQALGKGTDEPHVVHFDVKVAGNAYKYQPGKDTPRYADKRGPACYPKLVPPQHFPGPPQFYPDDGTSEPRGVNDSGPGPATPNPPATPPSHQPAAPATTTQQAGTASGLPAGSVANSPSERQLLAVLLAPQWHEQPADVPQWSSLLVGPLFRGAEVSAQ